MLAVGCGTAFNDGLNDALPDGTDGLRFEYCRWRRIYTVSAARLLLSEPFTRQSGHSCRRAPTHASGLSRRSLTLCAVSPGPTRRVIWRTSFGVRDNVRRRRELPLLGPTHLTVSGRGRCIRQISGFPGRAVTSRKRAAATDGRGNRSSGAQDERKDSGFTEIPPDPLSSFPRLSFFFALSRGSGRTAAAPAARSAPPSCPDSHRSLPRAPAHASRHPAPCRSA